MDNIERLNKIGKEISQYKYQLKILEDKFKNLKEEVKNIAKYCSQCNYWYNLQDLTAGSYETKETKVILQDCGYGDDDVLADVTIKHIVKRCPKCGGIIEQYSYELKQENIRNRK